MPARKVNIGTVENGSIIRRVDHQFSARIQALIGGEFLTVPRTFRRGQDEADTLLSLVDLPPVFPDVVANTN